MNPPLTTSLIQVWTVWPLKSKSDCNHCMQGNKNSTDTSELNAAIIRIGAGMGARFLTEISRGSILPDHYKLEIINWKNPETQR